MEERAKYIINLDKIINEKDQRTTLMIKKIFSKKYNAKLSYGSNK